MKKFILILFVFLIYGCNYQTNCKVRGFTYGTPSYISVKCDNIGNDIDNLEIIISQQLYNKLIKCYKLGDKFPNKKCTK